LNLDAQASLDSTLPSAAVRLQVWRDEHPGEPIRASISFGKLSSDDQIKHFIKQYQLQPYAIYMAASGYVGSYRVSPDKAADTVISAARTRSALSARRAMSSLRAQASDFLDGKLGDTTGAAGVATARALLASLSKKATWIQQVNTSSPVIYAFEAVGNVDDIALAGEDSRVQVFEPALSIKVRDRTVVPRPPIPNSLKPQILDSLYTQTMSGLSKEEVVRQIQTFAHMRWEE
jgi:hypothetical protein